MPVFNVVSLTVTPGERGEVKVSLNAPAPDDRSLDLILTPQVWEALDNVVRAVMAGKSRGNVIHLG